MDIKSKLSKLSIKLKNLSENFQCGICQGYIIDATTICECLHSFCKSCIVHFIQTIDHRCPTCNLALKDIKSCIRSDSSLQRLIYQLIPNLLENELDRREKFLHDNVNKSDMILNNKSLLNVKLYFESKINNNRFVKEKYIQCVAQTPISILIKLLRSKYNIPNNYTIKLSYMGHKLKDNETLLQLFTSFILTQSDLFEIRYELVRNDVKERPVKVECTTDLHENVTAFSKLNIKTNVEAKVENNKEEIAIKPIEQTVNSITTTASKIETETSTQLSLQPQPLPATAIITKEELLSEKSTKVLTKNFLKVKFRNRLSQSSGMSYPAFNLISMKRYQSNKKLRQLKKKSTLKQIKSSDENESAESPETKVNEQKDEINKIDEKSTEIKIDIKSNETENQIDSANALVQEQIVTKISNDKCSLDTDHINRNKSESDDEENKLLINEDSDSNEKFQTQNEKSSQNDRKTSIEITDSIKNDSSKEKINNENIENSTQTNNDNINNSLDLPLDLTIQKS